jgi:hypothetical protein
MLSMAIAAVRENNPPLVKGRQPTKFTPNNIARIKEWVAQGVCRDDIANRLEVTVNSLQVTCSKLGISLRKRPLANGAIPPVGVVQRSTENIRHVDDSARLKCKLLIQKQGKQGCESSGTEGFSCGAPAQRRRTIDGALTNCSRQSLNSPAPL